MLANWPEAEAHMNDQHYRVSIGTYDIDLEELHHPAGAAPISFVPVVAGAGAVGRILIGVALIAASIFIPGSTAIFATTFGKISLGVGLFGASLVIGGIAQLLTPTPKISQDEGDPRKSFSFSGIQNTSRAGVPVPVVYGETLVGSVVISAGIDIVQVSA